ncbi:2-phosphosulfolactate phosphatase [bacterium BMS3Abin03]|jgi:2-phosphosulfolactate phosphatase|nr:2-phosphosulfolactate phosphatase [bacterium BMS3Abin03]MCG6960871.1 2-phosphosulfolactate phosphatase [bacterium BMS3Abin03]
MKLNVLLSPLNADELYFTQKTTVVIDVLRASTTVISALSNGAKEVIPVGTVEFAVKVSGGMFGGQTLIGGERNTKRIEGFALGNSPLEYTRETVENKTIVFYTTNGSKAIARAKFSNELFVCSFNNLLGMAQRLIKLNKDVEILCAGHNNLFSLEDTVCAGMLVGRIKRLNRSVKISDSSMAAQVLYEKFGDDIPKMLDNTEHGKRLIQNGFKKDIEYCSRYNITKNIPYFDGNALKLLDQKPVEKK